MHIKIQSIILGRIIEWWTKDDCLFNNQFYNTIHVCTNSLIPNVQAKSELKLKLTKNNVSNNRQKRNYEYDRLYKKFTD